VNLVQTKDVSGISEYVRAMERLLRVIQDLSASRDLNTVMDIVRHSARDLTGSDGATFVLRDGDLCYYAEEDAISPLWKGHRFPMKICICGWVMMHKEPTINEDIYTDDRIPVDVYRKTFVRSLAMVPIRTKDPIGAIGCYWSYKHRATEEEVKVLHVLADTASIAMENIQYQNIIEQKAAQMEETLKGTLQAIAKMVEQKDLYTSGHQQRVGLIGYAIAKEMGWDEERCETVLRAGTIHDIGKIGIPGELLSKPAKLMPYEYAQIKTHSEAGYQILKDIPLLLPVAKIILQHHERIDGSGYPDGLKNEEILPEAQVLAIADVFESMTSHRPYRPALGNDAALEELEKNKGRLYNPEMVDVLIRLVQENRLEFLK
jgi:putative two-component system response regulator